MQIDKMSNKELQKNGLVIIVYLLNIIIEKEKEGIAE